MIPGLGIYPTMEYYSTIKTSELLYASGTDECQNDYVEWKKPDKLDTVCFHLYKILGNAN